MFYQCLSFSFQTPFSQIMSPARECRTKRDDCDLAEYCTGKSPECPEDVFAVNSLPCENGKSYCYNGRCPQKEEQCVRMWGASEWNIHQVLICPLLFFFWKHVDWLWMVFCSCKSGSPILLWPEHPGNILWFLQEAELRSVSAMPESVSPSKDHLFIPKYLMPCSCLSITCLKMKPSWQGCDVREALLSRR